MQQEAKMAQKQPPAGRKMQRPDSNQPQSIAGSCQPRGFALIELLVVITLISILVGLLLPAVQQTRESARKMKCQSNLRQMGIALQNFHSTHNRFPAGKLGFNSVDHSWCTFLLPYIEQTSLSTQFDLAKQWNDEVSSKNGPTAKTQVALFRCPTSAFEYAGVIDYCGISGGTQGGLQIGNNRDQALGSGVLVTVNEETPTYVSYRDIIDGSSNTICIAESVGRDDETGRWACGNNLVVTDVNPVGTPGKLASFHSNGVHALRADGSGMFISEDIDLTVLGAISTRNGGEVVSP
jgi:prepilin-type N-terminal cleavage/methylation domain-containing protein